MRETASESKKKRERKIARERERGERNVKNKVALTK